MSTFAVVVAVKVAIGMSNAGRDCFMIGEKNERYEGRGRRRREGGRK